MKRITVILLAVVLTGGILSAPAYASDWDKAGKALTIIEGIRLITGGKVDVIGSVTGVGKYGTYNDRHDDYWVHRGRDRGHHLGRRDRHYKKKHYKSHHHDRKCRERIWVPHYVYREEYSPRYETYDDEYGYIIVKSRKITKKVQDGGHWETRYTCGH